jgi:glycosyltransferase involved in cell wall biosynthesis
VKALVTKGCGLFGSHIARRSPEPLPAAAATGSTLKVLIIGSSFGFPYGQGATGRVYGYARALRHAGAEVSVISLAVPTRDDEVSDAPLSGVYEGIPYEYACGTRVRPASFLRRRALRLRALARVHSLIAQATRESHGRCVVLIYTGAAEWIVTLTAMARTCGAAAVLDLAEYPVAHYLRSYKALLLREARRTLAYAALDGIIPISTYLDQYVAASPRPPASLLVPLMVDTDLFNGSPPATGSVVRRVLYCGALGRNDEVERAVRSFAQAADDLPEAELLLVGYGPHDRVAQARDLVHELGLDERVTFTGDVRREELPVLYASAEVFVLPRRAAVFAVAGLPNKLGEYLASGRPVVVNANGDIPRYLVDGVSAYLVDPTDEAAFAARLRYVLEHRDEAAAVGARGREVAVREFDYRRHGTRLVEFFSCLVERRDGGDA